LCQRRLRRFAAAHRERRRRSSDSKILESCIGDLGCQFCFQQSAGNSPRPQVDVAPGTLWDWLLNQDIGNLESPARLENSVQLLEDSVFVWGQVDRAIGDDDVCPLVRHWQLLNEALFKENVRSADGLSVSVRLSRPSRPSCQRQRLLLYKGYVT
jgi:hypothetical protein